MKSGCQTIIGCIMITAGTLVMVLEKLGSYTRYFRGKEPNVLVKAYILGV